MHYSRIVLVTNTKKPPTKSYRKHMKRWDVAMFIANILLERAIRKNGYEVKHYTRINDFVENLHQHKDDLVFPYCYGVASKIRQSYVQTFCESQNIKYIGADAYTQTVTNDKVLTKEICRHSGIISPNCKILSDINYPPDILTLRLPLIVKPRFEGDSIGISNKGVFWSYDGVLPFAENLLKDLNQSIVIEEFIEGTEVSICMIGYARNIKKIGIIEHVKDGFEIKSYESKKINFGSEKFKDAQMLLNHEIESKVTDLFQSLDKVEFIRLDFIYKDGIFYNLELTPDPALSCISGMYAPFKSQMTFTEFIGFIISNCIERYQWIETQKQIG